MHQHRTDEEPARPDEPPPSRRRAALCSAGLSLLFVVVYAGCNWFTSLRANVGVIYFAWESRIPFVPWLIVPYMSIDLFFIAAPFLCASRGELRRLTRRLAAATLLAGVGFLLLPLTLARERPALDGALGAVYEFLKSGDRPHNLFPSLHVAYLLLLWPLYHAHTRGLPRVLVHAWFALILASVLPVYQHHFIDVVGGAGLAVFCWYLFPAGEPDFTPRRDIALRYAGAGAAAWAVTPWLGLWGLASAWLGLALATVACAYWLSGPCVFRKVRGRVPVAVRVLLAPYLLGLWATRRYYNRRAAAPFAAIGDGVIIGRPLHGSEASHLTEKGVSAVLDLTAEHSAAYPQRPYLNIQVLDLTTPTPRQCREAVRFIAAHAPRGPVYIQCGLGRSRSATVAAAYLLATGQAPTAEEACECVRRARPEVALGPAAIDLLREFEPGALARLAGQ